jgi:crossover junction endodeoxyribonuclease RusA
MMGCQCRATDAGYCVWCTTRAQRAGVAVASSTLQVPRSFEIQHHKTQEKRKRATNDPGANQGYLAQEGMLPSVTLTLPYPPSLNVYYRNVQGRTLISKRGREYRRQVGAVVMAQWPREVVRPWTGRLAVMMEVCAPTRRKMDLDNAQKSVWDSLQHALVYVNDSQIDDLHIRRGLRDAPSGHVTVTLTPL